MPAQPRPPSVEQLLVAVRPAAGPRDAGAVATVARAVIAEERSRLLAGAHPTPLERLADEVLGHLEALADPRRALPPITINATGVILHTNLGRAPWALAAVEAAAAVASGYALLELDRTTGRRGPRFRLAEDHVVALTGAADALVVNNNAAAVALAVALAGRGGRVLVSRGELVEIGGGVRIPEVVRRAGARLVEVGTTNRTRVGDFEAALVDGRPAMILRVHPSNFAMAGFVESPDPAALAACAHAHGSIVVDDLGSGALLDTAEFGLPHEPTPAERLEAGADLVTFSGDKLLGGPQAGLMAGRADLVARLRRDPLARAMRPDKVTLAALAATLGLYRAGLATREIPVWRMLAAPVGGLQARSEALAAALGERARARPVDGVTGGGSLPGATLPSWGVEVAARSPERLLAALRAGDPPVIGRIEDGCVVLDARTVMADDDERLLEAVRRAFVSAP